MIEIQCWGCGYELMSGGCEHFHNTAKPSEVTKVEPGTVVLPYNELGPTWPWMRTYKEGGYDGWTSMQGERVPCGQPGSPDTRPGIILVQVQQRTVYEVVQ